MSRLLVTNKSFELLEPYEGKLSRTVLRGESSRKGADLLDIDRQQIDAAFAFRNTIEDKNSDNHYPDKQLYGGL